MIATQLLTEECILQFICDDDCGFCRLPYVVLLNRSRLYCVDRIDLLQRTDNSSLCDER